jgi:hypothetical protein
MATGLVASGCASQLHSEVKSRELLAQPLQSSRPANASAEAELRGATAAAYGDDQTAVKLFERSYAQHPTVANEMNLAAAYARTGRPKQAIDLYQRVVASKGLEEGTTETTVRQNGPVRNFTYQQEARQRILDLQASATPGDHDAAPLSNAQAAHADSISSPK